MINVSNDYKDMMLGRVVENRIEITITSGDDVYHLTDDDIVKGSLQINWRACNNKDFGLGSCYASSLSFSSFVSVIPEIEGQYITISAVVFYKVGNTEQEIPLGIFRCDSPSVFSMTTSYECTDFMLAFDQAIESRFSGTVYNVLTFICNRCGMELANSAQNIAGMINGTQTIVIDPERIVTYRDALSYIATILGGYCIIDRRGYLSVRHFHSSSDLFIPRHRRENTTFAGYKTIVNGVKCRFLADQNFYPYEIIDSTREGITIDLGDIPIINDTERVKNEILQRIYNLLITYEFYPCEINMVGDPSIEAGDMITTQNREGYNRNLILTSVSYSWRASSNITSEGGNPKAKAVSSPTKKNSVTQDQIAKQSKVVTATYVNANTIAVGESSQANLIDLRFSTMKDLTAVFGAEIPVYSDGDGYIEISYVDAGVTGDVVKARVHEGYNLITLVNHLYYDANRIVLLQLKAQTEALTSEGTAPEVTISQDTIRSYIFAQGLETEEPWDGIITISENIEYIETHLDLYGITDGCTVSLYSPIDDSISEFVTALTAGVQTYGISDTMSLDLLYGEQYLKCGAGHRAGNGRMFAPLNR